MTETLIQKFTYYFIPHSENQFQPRFLQPKTTIIIFIIIVVVENLFFLTSYYLISSPLFLANLIEESIVQYTNMSRANTTLPELKISPVLSQAAQLKAEDMAAKGYFSHISPDSITPWDWLKKVNYDYSYAGENLAINFTDSEEVVKAWLESETHRQNILNPHFTEIGIGIAKGTYENQPAIFIVQMFGAPKMSSQNIPAVPEMTSVPKMNNTTLTPVPRPLSSPRPSPQIQTIAPTLTALQPEVMSMENVPQQSSTHLSLFQKIFSNPKQTTNTILTIFAGIIIIALILKFIVQIKIQFPLLIANGILLLIVITSAFWVNNLLFNIWPSVI